MRAGRISAEATSEPTVGKRNPAGTAFPLGSTTRGPASAAEGSASRLETKVAIEPSSGTASSFRKR
jgi:hypothetical protein